jgi:outer membrane biosynthesis protein TonB
MGLFDKIKDNAKNISMKAIEASQEYNAEEPETKQPSGIVTAAHQESDEPDADTKKTAITPKKDSTKKEATEVAVVVATPKDEPDTTEVLEAEPETKPSEEPKALTQESTKTEQTPPSTPQTSRVFEVPKNSLHNYTPSYKTTPPVNKVKNGGTKFLDVTPKKTTDPAKEALYARERAALSALASQRRLNGTVALYVTQHLSFKTRVFIDRIEYIGSFGKNVIPIEQVAWVKLRHGGTGVILETHKEKRIVLVVKPKDRLDFADAVLKVQSMQPKREKFKDDKTVRIDQLDAFSEGVDEIEKLAKLFDKGIISREEFDTKKKQILGI